MDEKTINSNRRRLAGLIIFALFFLILGRNLSFIPKFNFNRSTEQTALKNIVEKIIAGKAGFYSVYFEDLTTGEYFGIDEHQIETSASVNKVPIMAVLYYLSNKGQMSLDNKVTINKNDVQDYGTGSIRYQTLPVSYSLRNLAKLAIQESDNTAAHVLGVKIGTDKTQSLIDSWRMRQTDMTNDKSTVYDMSLVFKKIYGGEITNPAETTELLSFLTDSDTEDRLPKDLPKGTIVYHKTGDGLGVINDVGIIKTANHVYYLGIMTSDIGDNEVQAKDIIAEISKKVFDFEENN